MEKLIKTKTESLSMILAQWKSYIILRRVTFCLLWRPFGVDSRQNWRRERGQNEYKKPLSRNSDT